MREWKRPNENDLLYIADQILVLTIKFFPRTRAMHRFTSLHSIAFWQVLDIVCKLCPNRSSWNDKFLPSASIRCCKCPYCLLKLINSGKLQCARFHQCRLTLILIQLIYYLFLILRTREKRVSWSEIKINLHWYKNMHKLLIFTLKNMWKKDNMFLFRSFFFYF